MGKNALKNIRGTTEKLPRPELVEYAFVRLCHDVQVGSTTYASGTRGVIVHRHDDGIGYEVEFETPAFRVITLTARDIRADHG